MTGSRRALLLSSTLILARRHHLEPSLEPVVISSKCLRLSSTLSSLCFEGIPFPRSSRIYNPIRECISSTSGITDLQLFSVIGISLAILDELNGIVVDRFKIVGGVGYNITPDIKKFQIIQYGFFKFSLQKHENPLIFTSGSDIPSLLMGWYRQIEQSAYPYTFSRSIDSEWQLWCDRCEDNRLAQVENASQPCLLSHPEDQEQKQQPSCLIVPFEHEH